MSGVDIDAALAKAAADEMAAQSLSTPRLAARSGLPISTTYAVLTGRQAISAHEIESIATALGMAGSQLLARAEHLLD